MCRRFVVTAIGGLLLSLFISYAEAALITVGSVTVPQGTPTVNIPVSISTTTNELVNAISLGFAVGDGGAVLGGIDIVPITGATIAGGIFSPSAFGSTLGKTPPLPSSSASILDIAIVQENTNASANGLVVTVTLDTSSLVSGQRYVLDGNAGGITAASYTSGTLDLGFASGLLTITAVPEPSTALGVVTILLPALARRRRRS